MNVRHVNIHGLNIRFLHVLYMSAGSWWISNHSRMQEYITYYGGNNIL